MAWSKIDDQMHSHPKVKRAWDANKTSLGLHLLALSYAGAYLTDGHVPETFVKTQLPIAASRRRAVKTLVDSGLWEPSADGWQIHDYLDHNPSKSETAAEFRKRIAQLSPSRARARPGPGPTPDPFPTGVQT